MDIRERNEVIRRILLDNYYIPELRKMGYIFSKLKSFKGKCLTKDKIIHLYFNTSEANDTTDSFMWCPTYYLVSHPKIALPDFLKRQFHRVPDSEDLMWYRHFVRLIDLEASLREMDSKTKELYDTLDLAGVFGRKKTSS